MKSLDRGLLDERSFFSIAEVAIDDAEAVIVIDSQVEDGI